MISRNYREKTYSNAKSYWQTPIIWEARAFLPR